MKRKGAVMEYSKERVRDLMRAYDEYLSSCDYIRMPEVYRMVANMPASRFWVSEIRASLVVSAIMRKEADLDSMWPLRKEMYEEIYRRVLDLKTKQPNLSILELCTIVVSQPAPKFYLTAGSAKMIICKARKEWVAEKLRRLRIQ